MVFWYHKKHFTLEQANRIVLGMTHLVKELIELKMKLDEKGYDIYRHQYFGGGGPNGDRFYPAELDRLVEILKQFDKKGIKVKDLDQGLIDFPHIRSNGEEVYLCWKFGEESINFWHGIEEGFLNRKSVKEL